MTETYGRRRVPRMYAKINNLRTAIRSEGSPAVQDAWDEVEQFIDFSYGVVGKLDTQSECQPTIGVFDYISKHEQPMRSPCLTSTIFQMVSKLTKVLRLTR